MFKNMSWEHRFLAVTIALLIFDNLVISHEFKKLMRLKNLLDMENEILVTYFNKMQDPCADVPAILNEVIEKSVMLNAERQF